MSQAPHSSECSVVDVTKTLSELTGVDWDPPPPDARLTVEERHRTRSKQLKDWSHRELIRFLCIGVDEHVLVPVAIARLREDPVASGCDRPGELLSAVLESDGFDWRSHPQCVRLVREIVAAAESEIGQEDDPLKTLNAGWHLYRSWAIFERRLSSIV